MEERIHSLRVGWRNLFLQLCCCVSFLFWREIGFGDIYLYCPLWSPCPPKTSPFLFCSFLFFLFRLLNKFHSNNTQLIPTVKINQLPLLFLGIPRKQCFSRTHESPWYLTMASLFAPFLVAQDSDFLSRFYTFCTPTTTSYIRPHISGTLYEFSRNKTLVGTWY